jgi:hypothetical protein
MIGPTKIIFLISPVLDEPRRSGLRSITLGVFTRTPSVLEFTYEP